MGEILGQNKPMPEMREINTKVKLGELKQECSLNTSNEFSKQEKKTIKLLEYNTTYVGFIKKRFKKLQVCDLEEFKSKGLTLDISNIMGILRISKGYKITYKNLVDILSGNNQTSHIGALKFLLEYTNDYKEAEKIYSEIFLKSENISFFALSELKKKIKKLSLIDINLLLSKGINTGKLNTMLEKYEGINYDSFISILSKDEPNKYIDGMTFLSRFEENYIKAGEEYEDIILEFENINFLYLKKFKNKFHNLSFKDIKTILRDKLKFDYFSKIKKNFPNLKVSQFKYVIQISNKGINIYTLQEFLNIFKNLDPFLVLENNLINKIEGLTFIGKFESDYEKAIKAYKELNKNKDFFRNIYRLGNIKKKLPKINIEDIKNILNSKISIFNLENFIDYLLQEYEKVDLNDTIYFLGRGLDNVFIKEINDKFPSTGLDDIKKIIQNLKGKINLEGILIILDFETTQESIELYNRINTGYVKVINVFKKLKLFISNFPSLSPRYILDNLLVDKDAFYKIDSLNIISRFGLDFKGAIDVYENFIGKYHELKFKNIGELKDIYPKITLELIKKILLEDDLAIKITGLIFLKDFNFSLDKSLKVVDELLREFPQIEFGEIKEIKEKYNNITIGEIKKLLKEDPLGFRIRGYASLKDFSSDIKDTSILYDELTEEFGLIDFANILSLKKSYPEIDIEDLKVFLRGDNLDLLFIGMNELRLYKKGFLETFSICKDLIKKFPRIRFDSLSMIKPRLSIFKIESILKKNEDFNFFGLKVILMKEKSLEKSIKIVNEISVKNKNWSYSFNPFEKKLVHNYLFGNSIEDYIDTATYSVSNEKILNIINSSKKNSQDNLIYILSGYSNKKSSLLPEIKKNKNNINNILFIISWSNLISESDEDIVKYAEILYKGDIIKDDYIDILKTDYFISKVRQSSLESSLPLSSIYSIARVLKTNMMMNNINLKNKSKVFELLDRILISREKFAGYEIIGPKTDIMKLVHTHGDPNPFFLGNANDSFEANIIDDMGNKSGSNIINSSRGIGSLSLSKNLVVKNDNMTLLIRGHGGKENFSLGDGIVTEKRLIHFFKDLYSKNDYKNILVFHDICHSYDYFKNFDMLRRKDTFLSAKPLPNFITLGNVGTSVSKATWVPILDYGYNHFNGEKFDGEDFLRYIEPYNFILNEPIYKKLPVDNDPAIFWDNGNEIGDNNEVFDVENIS